MICQGLSGESWLAEMFGNAWAEAAFRRQQRIAI
jgi:hypothetical protein